MRPVSGENMDNNTKKPALFVALVITVFLAGGFLFIVYVGVNSMPPQKMHSHLTFRYAADAASAYFESFQKSSEIIKNKAESFIDSFFAETGGTVPGSKNNVTAQRKPSRYDNMFGKNFEEYARDYESLRDGESGSLAEGSGESAYGGYMSSGRQDTMTQNAYRKGPRKAAKAGAASSGAGKSASAPGAVPSQAASAGNRAAAPRLQASLPMKNTKNTPVNTVSRPPSGGALRGYGNSKPQKSGGLQNFRDKGPGPGGVADGASEGMRAASQSGYNSKMSGGGASASAGASASSNASVPAAATPRKLSTKVKPGDITAEPGSDTGADTAGELFAGNFIAEDLDLVRSVIADKLNGADANYLSDERAAPPPVEPLLKAGAIAGMEDIKKDPADVDPENFDSLSKERKESLKKEMHTFLKAVEDKYGPMNDIYHTTCRSAPDVCKTHGLSQNYLTMTTQKGAKLVLGVKYVNSRWRRYTIDFKTPESKPGQPPASGNRK